MERAAIRRALLVGIENGSLFSTLNGFEFKAVRTSDSLIAEELAHLHNDSKLDLNKQFLGLKKSDNQYSLYSLMHIYCSTLPKLNCAVADVVEIFIHVKSQDLPPAEFEQAYYLFCKSDFERSKSALDYLLVFSEKAYGLIANTIMAAAEFDSEWVLNQLRVLMKHQSPDVRWQAYLAAGRVSLIDEEAATVRFDLLDEASSIETDSSAKSGIVRAAGFLAKQSPDLWPHVNLLLGKCLETLEPKSLYEASRLLAYGSENLPEDTIQSLLPYLKRAQPSHLGILDSLSLFIIDVIKEEKFLLAEDLLESLLLNNEGLKIDDFQFSTHELTNKKNNYFLNRIVTKWFLMEEEQLHKALHDIVSGAGLDGHELSFDQTFLPLSDNELLFLSRKVIGWFYFHPISVISYLLSIIPYVSSDARSKIGRLLYEPMLISYTVKGKSYVSEKLDSLDDETKKIVEKSLSDLESYQSGIKDSEELKELKAPQREVDLYWRDFNSKMSKSMEESRKNSILELIGTTQTILYGHDVVSHIYMGSETRRSINTMHSFSHSSELPKLSVLDPEGLDVMLRIFRNERLKDEVDS